MGNLESLRLLAIKHGLDQRPTPERIDEEARRILSLEPAEREERARQIRCFFNPENYRRVSGESKTATQTRRDNEYPFWDDEDFRALLLAIKQRGDTQRE